MRETRAWWEATADYFQGEDPVEVGIDWGPGSRTGEVGLLPDVTGLDVVELGCGGGQLGIGIADHDPESVTGIDLSRAQLEYAINARDEHDVAMALIEGDITTIPLEADCADVVVSAYVLQWVPSLPTVFEEVARILRVDGVLVVSVPHPFYSVFDPEREAIDRSYHDPVEQRVEEPGIEADQVLYRRRISDIHAAIRDAGFVVDHFVEPGRSDPDSYSALWNSNPELMAKIPRTVVLRACRPHVLSE